MSGLRLNLAAGTDIRDGWVNLDVVKKWPLARRACDVIWDATKDRIPFPDGSVDEVYCGYLFLHVAARHHACLLSDIRRVLKSGGVLVVGEVDMALLMPRWLADPSDEYLAGLVWGEAGTLSPEQQAAIGPAGVAAQLALADYDAHRRGFTEASLRALIQGAGFRGSERIRIHDARVWFELTIRATNP